MPDSKVKQLVLNLDEVDRVTLGISVCEIELSLRLMQYSDLDITGIIGRGLFRTAHHMSDYERFNFPVKLMKPWAEYFSYYGTSRRYKFAQIVRKLIPSLSNYNFWSNGEEDSVYMFFLNKTPVIPIRGKAITTIYDITPLTPAGEATYGRSNCYDYKMNFENAIRQSSKIITVSNYSKSDIINYSHIGEDKIEVIYCGINSEQFQRKYTAEEMSTVRRKYHLPEKYILYFGVCRKYKNVESIIRAYTLLPDSTRKEYSLVISNPDESVKACAVESGIDVCYIRDVDSKDKAAIYQMASVLVWVSLYEGFGLPIVEAMASGVPVVCSNVTSIPEIAGDAAVLSNPWDIRTIAEGIERCLYDKQFRAALIDKGYENIKRFSWDASARKLHDIIVNL